MCDKCGIKHNNAVCSSCSPPFTGAGMHRHLKLYPLPSREKTFIKGLGPTLCTDTGMRVVQRTQTKWSKRYSSTVLRLSGDAGGVSSDNANTVQRSSRFWGGAAPAKITAGVWNPAAAKPGLTFLSWHVLRCQRGVDQRCTLAPLLMEGRLTVSPACQKLTH